jgi:hypothetical protein
MPVYVADLKHQAAVAIAAAFDGAGDRGEGGAN